jgi:5-methylcytosine-specific restriction enzyme subunit McrC
MSQSLTFRLAEHERSGAPLPAGFDVAGLQAYLRTAWDRRLLWDDEEATAPKGEPLLSVEYGGYLRAHNYVGLVQWQGLRVEIHPKLFGSAPPDGRRWFGHLLWWLSYCRRVRFPFASVLAELTHVEDFPEAIIAHFARFAYRVLSTQPYSRYQEVTEALPYVRGRLSTGAYVHDSLSRGLPHQLVCEHEPFVYDNRLNRIIKYVARQLSYVCRFGETYQALSRVLFLLDEVSDLPATATDCDGIHLNPLFNDYADVLAMCRFFLSENYIDLTDTIQANYCFLVPMEYVFEDFLRGFLEENFGEEYKIEYQKTGWLTDEQLFQLRHDLFLTHRISGQRLIVDAKYKMRGEEGTDKKAGVAQSDMYQLVSYCLRSNCCQGVLLYPGTDGQAIPAVQQFTISSELMRPEKNDIVLRAASLPVTGTLDDGNKRAAHLKKTIQQLLDLCI